MNNEAPNLSNPFTVKRAIAVARVISEDQHSMEKQIELIRTYADTNGIEVIDELRLDSKSASLSERESFLQQLIARKKARNDFDSMLACDFSRFVRVDGSRFIERLKLAGINLILLDGSSTGSVLDAIYLDFCLQAARTQRQSRSLAAKRGWAKRKHGKSGGGR